MAGNMMNMFDGSKDGLRRRANAQLSEFGITFFPPVTEPSIQAKHIDGPVLHRLNGTMSWLTWRERFAVWRGREDAWSLERKRQRREYEIRRGTAR